MAIGIITIMVVGIRENIIFSRKEYEYEKNNTTKHRL